MEGKTHMLSGLALFSALGAITKDTNLLYLGHLSNTTDYAVISLASILLGTIMPDMDLPGSTVSSKITLVNMKMVKIIVNTILAIFAVSVIIFSGNKYTLYGGCTVFVILILSYKSITHKFLYILRRIIQITIVGGLFAGFFVKHEPPLLFISIVFLCFIFSKHRGLSHTLILGIVSSFCVYTSFVYYDYEKYSYYASAYYFVGFFIHVYLNDYFTNKGVPNPLYPLINILRLPINMKKWGFSKKTFRETLKINKVKFLITMDTGSTGEVLFSMVCVGIIAFSAVGAFLR